MICTGAALTISIKQDIHETKKDHDKTYAEGQYKVVSVPL
jgi:hypothetical protein